jgi:hypothetical protein
VRHQPTRKPLRLDFHVSVAMADIILAEARKADCTLAVVCRGLLEAGIAAKGIEAPPAPEGGV